MPAFTRAASTMPRGSTLNRSYPKQVSFAIGLRSTCRGEHRLVRPLGSGEGGDGVARGKGRGHPGPLIPAGELARETGDATALAAQMTVYANERNDATFRSTAYSALLRAAGKEWRDVPGVSTDTWRVIQTSKRFRLSAVAYSADKASAWGVMCRWCRCSQSRGRAGRRPTPRGPCARCLSQSLSASGPSLPLPDTRRFERTQLEVGSPGFSRVSGRFPANFASSAGQSYSFQVGLKVVPLHS